MTVTLGGRSALQLDGRIAHATSCGILPDPYQATRGRVYLVDLPGGSGARVLAIAIFADEDSFETVLEWAAPIVDSVEFPRLSSSSSTFQRRLARPRSGAS